MEINPTVSAVMLVNGREAMVRRAIRAFEAQTYERKKLIIFDTGFGGLVRYKRHFQHVELGRDKDSIGKLRNSANALTAGSSPFTSGEVIIHWDSDDWSHPNRIAEQVALLVDSGKECVGYNEVLFWSDIGFTAESTPADIAKGDGEAWLYRNVRHDYAIGASLCYWRDVWERHPFPDLPKRKGGTGEDTEWIRGVRCAGVSSIGYSKEAVRTATGQMICADINPRMICAIHGGNSMDYSDAALSNTPSWQRVPQWDAHCRATMAL